MNYLFSRNFRPLFVVGSIASAPLWACSSNDPQLPPASSGGATNGSGGGVSGGATGETGGGSPSGSGGNSLGSGGTPSSGGAAGSSGGSDASGGDDGTSTGGSTTLPTDAIIFEEDFEAAADDTVPAGWNSFVSYVVDMNNAPGGDTFALADSSKAHGGSKALHVKGTSNPAQLTRPLPDGTNAIYVRAYVYLTNKLGANPGNNHETLIGIRGTPGGANDEVRFGEIKGVVGTNEVPSDDISPTMDQWGQGPEIAAGMWNCVEVAFLGDTDNHSVIAWNNGTEVHRVDDPSQWQNKVLGPTFLEGKFVEFMIGWHSFSSYANEIWFDDIVVATERVGCD